MWRQDLIEHLIMEVLINNLSRPQAADRAGEAAPCGPSGLWGGEHDLLDLPGAISGGRTREELCAIVLRLPAYAGRPATVEALRLAQTISAEDDSGGGSGR